MAAQRAKSALSVEGVARLGLSPTHLSVGAGEIVAVMGPSGAGKSILLRAIADLDPHEGAVKLQGAAAETMPAPTWRRRVAYLPAESGWWAERVREHFQDPEAAEPLMRRLGFPGEALDWSIDRLSTGERQRLALIRALEQAPEVLLLDEPSGALDEKAEAAVEALLREEAEKGVAILLVTHDEAQARRLAKRRYRMAGGVLSEDRPEDESSEEGAVK